MQRLMTGTYGCAKPAQARTPWRSTRKCGPMTAHIVALSGGKDSTALALRLAEVAPRDYLYVCTPTGDELPEMFDHWRRLGDLLGKPIMPVMSDGTLQTKIEQYKMLPSFRARWCTRELKLEPFHAFCLRLGLAVVYVGLRADEEGRGGFQNLPGVELRYPLREWGWGLKEVLDFLCERGIEIPARTDCGSCFFQRLGEWWNLWREHPDLYQRYVDNEKMVSEMRGKECTYRSPSRDTQPTRLFDLKARFETGYIPKGINRQPDLFGQAKCRMCSL